MTEPFKITEVVQYGKISEFTFKGLKDLVNNIRMLASFQKLKENKKYHIVIEEVR